MIQGRCRIWNISILAVVFLSIYNVILTFKLLYSPQFTKPPTSRTVKATPKIQKCDNQKLLNNAKDDLLQRFDIRLGRWDNRLQYKLFDNVIVGERYAELNEYHKTCLATQSSLDRMASLEEVAANWNGPISLATFAASEQELKSLLLYIFHLRRCNGKVRDQVSFHFAFPRNHTPKIIDIDYEQLAQIPCDSSKVAVELFFSPRTKIPNWRIVLPYPQNHLRNLARKNCQSEYVFLTDVDIIPSKNMSEGLNVFLALSQCRGQCAFVIPTYELDRRVQFPANKTDLIRLASKGLARPFHQRSFIYNQFATNFSRWQNTTVEPPEVHISHPVTNFEFLYEPFYVARDTVPPHDERFIGYGYTRNTQVYEMYVAGYQFLVLSPIFTCHWGFRVKRNNPNLRERQNFNNREHFNQFKKEVFAKYNRDPLNMITKKKIKPAF